MPNLAERIAAKTEKRGPDECWLWTGGIGQKGAPVGSELGKSVSPRRLIWEWHNGRTLNKNEHVSTTCGVFRCLNPAHLYVRHFMNDEARFWSHVRKADGNACWEWQSTFFNNGYATFKMQGKQRHAARVAYEFAFGPIEGHVPGHPEKERVIMHKCDNPKCVRPDHLKLGSDADNIKDMLAKGRAAWQRDPAGFREKVMVGQGRSTGSSSQTQEPK